MWKDEIVEEVRRIRDARAKRFNYDIDRIIADAGNRQRHSAHRLVSFAKPARRSLVESDATGA